MNLKPLFGGLVVLALAATPGRAQFTWIGASAVSGDIILAANWRETATLDRILLNGSAITFGDATQVAVWMDSSELTTVLGTSNLTFGSLTFSSATAAYSFGGVNSPTITLNGDITTTVANSNRVNFNSTVGLVLAGASHSIAPVSGSGVIIASPISGSGAALTKSGAGGLYLSGANTYTGGTILNAGLLSVTNATGSGTGTGTITINGGTLYIGYFTANGSIAGNIVMNTDGSAVADFSRTTPYTYSGTITGTGELVAEGGSTLTLSGVNTFTGYTGLMGGTLADGVAGAFSPNSPMSFHTGSSLNVNYNETIPGLSSYDAGAGTATIAGGTTLTINSAASYAYSGVVTGAGALVKAGTGTETLTGANTYTGTTTINGGTLAISADNGLGTAPASATPGQLSLDGGTLRSSGTFTLASNRGINLGTSGGAFNTDAATALTYGGIIAGSGPLTKLGAGSLYLSGANTYTGGTTLNAGVLAVTNTAGSGTGTGTITINGGTFYIGYFTANGSIAGNIVMNTDGSAVADFSRTTPYTYAGTITGTGGLTAEGGSTLTLSGANTFSGYTSLFAGTLADGSAGAFSPNSPMSLHTGSSLSVNYNELIPGLESYNAGAGTTTIAGGVTLTINNAGDYAYSGVVTGAGALAKAGAGTETFTGVNTYTGATAVTGGTLAISADSGLGTAPASATPGQLFFDGGTLRSSAAFTLAANRGINLGTSGGGFNTDAATTLTYGGIIAGSGLLTKLGAGTLTLSGSNTYAGGTAITDGTLVAGAASALGLGAVTLNGGRLNLSGGVTFTNPLVFGVSGGILGGTGTFGSAVSVGSNVTLAPGSSPGTLTFGSGLTLAPAGSYQWELESVTGTPGQPTTWDLIAVNGALDITATSANPFTLRIISLDGLGNPGLVSNFDSASAYTWTIATASGGITGFSAPAFALDASLFQNSLGAGSFFVTADSTNLMLNFTPVPEPSTYALMAAGLAVLLAVRRRFRRR